MKGGRQYTGPLICKLYFIISSYKDSGIYPAYILVKELSVTCLFGLARELRGFLLHQRLV